MSRDRISMDQVHVLQHERVRELVKQPPTAQRFGELRRWLGLTKEALAKLLSVDRPDIEVWEFGDELIPEEVWVAMVAKAERKLV